MPSSDEEIQQSQFFKTLFHVFFVGTLWLVHQVATVKKKILTLVGLSVEKNEVKC